MQLLTGLTVFAASLMPVWANMVIVVVGGGSNDLMFKPQSIEAVPGDVVTFQFYTTHSIVQSAFNNPCHPLPSGFSSGLIAPAQQNGGTAMSFLLTINDPYPIWFYESQARNCQDGMVGVINQSNNSLETIEAYKLLAISQTENISPDGGVRGGLLDNNGASSSSSTSLDTSPSTSLETSSSASLNTSPSTSLDTSPSTYLDTAPSTSLETSPSTSTSNYPSDSTNTIIQSDSPTTSFPSFSSSLDASIFVVPMSDPDMTNIIFTTSIPPFSSSLHSSNSILRSSETHTSPTSSTSIFVSASTCPSPSIGPESTIIPSPTNEHPLFPGLNKGSAAVDISVLNLGILAILGGVVLVMVWLWR